MSKVFNAQSCKHIAETFAKQNLDPAASQQLAAAHIKTMLGNTGHSFASLVQCTKVGTAAAHKALTILKMSYSNISIASKLNEFTNLYENAMKRSAAKIEGNDAQAIEAFQSQGSWFEHTDVYSVIKHKTNDALYLFAIYHKSHDSAYYNADTNAIMTKEEVAVFLTPAEAKKVLAEDTVNHSVSTGLSHTVYVRTLGLQNVIDLKAAKSQYSA